jgi:hypothetical protein
MRITVELGGLQGERTIGSPVHCNYAIQGLIYSNLPERLGNFLHNCGCLKILGFA